MLSEMFTELGLVVLTRAAGQNVTLAVNAFLDPYLLYSFAAALLMLGLCRPSWRIIASWVIYIALIIMMALLGRPAILRVYYPLLVFLTVVPLLSRPSAFRQYLICSVAISCLLANAAHLYSEVSGSKLLRKDDLLDLKLVNDEPLYV